MSLHSFGCASWRSNNGVRQESRIVAGDRAFILADGEAAWGVVDQPASDDRVLQIEILQAGQGLADIAFCAVGALLFCERRSRADDGHVGALARVERLADIRSAEFLCARVI